MLEFSQWASRFWHDLIDRPGGPMSFRFFLQPTMAVLFAIRDGIKDAHMGRTPYFWIVLHDAARRNDSLREGFKATLRIILLGLVMDLIYQFLVFHAFYPLEAIVITFVLAYLPYLLVRGPVTRLVRFRMRRKAMNLPANETTGT